MIAPSVTFQRRYAYQALDAAVARGEPDILIRGPRGCGKTVMVCDFLYRLGLLYPGMTQTWFRKDRTDMDDSVLAAFEDEVLGIGHPLRSGPSRSSRNGYDLGNGTTIRLRGLKGSDSQKSISADLIWVCEGSELTEQEYDEIGVTKRQRVGVTAFPFQCKLTDFNPMPPSHWTNTRCPEFPRHLYPRVPPGDGSDLPDVFTPEMYCLAQEFNFAPLDRSQHQSKLIVCFHADNPGYWNLDPWGWSEPGLKYCRDTLAPLGSNMRARYLEGRPVSTEGVVFPEFDREKHVCEPFGVADWPIIVYYDPGYDHPAAVGFLCISSDGQPFVVDEIYGSKITLGELADRIKKKVRDKRYNVVDWLADPNGAFQHRQEASGRSIAEQLHHDHDLDFRPWPMAKSAEKQAQVEGLRDWLLMPEPIQFFKTCVNHVNEMESWCYKRMADGSMPQGDDAYEDRSNHAIDGLCGARATRPTIKRQLAGTLRKA